MATGHGLADAYRAALIARFRCILPPPIITPPVINPPVVTPPISPSPAGSTLTEEEMQAMENMILGSED